MVGIFHLRCIPRIHPKILQNWRMLRILIKMRFHQMMMKMNNQIRVKTSRIEVGVIKIKIRYLRGEMSKQKIKVKKNLLSKMVAVENVWNRFLQMVRAVYVKCQGLKGEPPCLPMGARFAAATAATL